MLLLWFPALIIFHQLIFSGGHSHRPQDIFRQYWKVKIKDNSRKVLQALKTLTLEKKPVQKTRSRPQNYWILMYIIHFYVSTLFSLEASIACVWVLQRAFEGERRKKREIAMFIMPDPVSGWRLPMSETGTAIRVEIEPNRPDKNRGNYRLFGYGFWGYFQGVL